MFKNKHYCWNFHGLVSFRYQVRQKSQHFYNLCWGRSELAVGKLAKFLLLKRHKTEHSQRSDTCENGTLLKSQRNTSHLIHGIMKLMMFLAYFWINKTFICFDYVIITSLSLKAVTISIVWYGSGFMKWYKLMRVKYFI